MAWTDGIIERWRSSSIAAANNSPVTAWTSEVGGMTFSQANATKKPIYKTAVWNGHPAVSFNDTTHGMEPSGNLPAGLTGFSMAVVGIPRGNLYTRLVSGTPNTIFLAFTRADNYIFYNSGNGTTGLASVGNLHVVTGTIDPAAPGFTSSTGYLDGVGSQTFGVNLPTELYLGLAANAQPADADFFEVVVWDRTLTAQEAADFYTDRVAFYASPPPVPDTTPPTASITSHANGQTVSGQITVSGTCADNVAVVSSQPKLDGANFGTETTGTNLTSFSKTFDTTALSNASHNFGFTVKDAANNQTTVSVDLTVYNAPAPPVASFTKSAVSGLAPLTVNFTDTSTFSPTTWAWNFSDGVTSTAQNPSHTFISAGVYTVSLLVNGGSSTSQTVTVTNPVIGDLPHGFPGSGAELFVEPEADGVASGQSFNSLIDYSGKNRPLSAASNPPSCVKPAVGGRAVVRFGGSNNPLSNPAGFQINCGWIVAKYNLETFAGYHGLLTDLTAIGILVGNNATDYFFDFSEEFYEYRAGDKIYPSSTAKAPMNEFKIIFFRFWQPITVNGIQLGQDRADASRKWNGDVAFLALYSRNFCESDIRKYSRILADLYALQLADVYPYQADKSSSESSAQSVNFYDPPEGSRIAESIENPNRALELEFSSRRSKELREMRAFHATHFATAAPCIYRDYSIIPPEDVEGYIDSEYEKTGALNNYNYKFSFRENNSENFTPQQPANYLEVFDTTTGLIVIQEI